MLSYVQVLNLLDLYSLIEVKNIFVLYNYLLDNLLYFLYCLKRKKQSDKAIKWKYSNILIVDYN